MEGEEGCLTHHHVRWGRQSGRYLGETRRLPTTVGSHCRNSRCYSKFQNFLMTEFKFAPQIVAYNQQECPHKCVLASSLAYQEEYNQAAQFLD